MDDKKFLEICQEENKKLALITEKEIVSEELAYRALIVANNMELNDVGDVMLFASALNILNTYVKQSEECKKAVSYAFKSKVDDILQYLLKNPNENIIAEIQEDNGTSLCIMSIYSIQFSFHCITVTEQNKCFQQLDPAKQKVHFDNIRKHSCSVTLYDFAYDNAYGRTNKMLDGSDFLSEMDKLVEEYRAGTKTIGDVRQTIYHPNNYSSSGKENGEIPVEKTYTGRNRYIVALSILSVRQFLQQVTNRQIVSKLTKAYADQTRLSIGMQYITYIKYALEYFAGILNEINANPDTSVCLLFSRIPTREGLNVLLCSKDDNGTKKITFFELLNWTNMKLTDDGKVSLYDSTVNMYINMKHPSISSYALTINNSEYISDNTEFRNCILFFDAEKTAENDITSGLPDGTDILPTYYASDRKAILEEVKSAALYGNGENVVFDIISAIDRVFNTSSGEITSEHEFVIENAVRAAEESISSLFITSIRKVPGNTEYLDRLLERYSQSDIKVDVYSDASDIPSKAESAVAVFNDFIPDESVLDEFKQVIVLCDLYDPSSRGMDIPLKETAYEKKIRNESNFIVSALGYSDGGAGIGWILRNFNISYVAPQNIQLDKYPIYIVGRKDEFNGNSGIKTVTIPESFRYDDENKRVVSSPDDQKALYDSIITASSGICLSVSNDRLRSYLTSMLEKDINPNLDDCSDECEEEIRKKLDMIRSVYEVCAPNSDIYNHYMAVAVSCLRQDAWQKLRDDSKDWVVSALSAYYSMSVNDANMDYSGPVLLLSKTFEDELVSRISAEYAAYLQNKYGENYVNHLPEELVQKNKNVVTPVNPEKVSLGSLPHIMGVDAKGKITSEKDYDEFLEYCNDILAADTKNVESDIKNLCEIIYHVRTKYRNKAAHTTAISYDDATDCVEYSITKDRMLGVVMDFFRQ